MKASWRRVGFAIAAAIAVGTVVTMVALGRVQTAPPQPDTAEKVMTAASTASRAPASPLQLPASTVAGYATPVSHALLAERAKAVDLRQFALDAMKRPAEGGLFHAFMAATHCSGDLAERKRKVDGAIRNAVQQRGTVDLAQLAAAERLARQCSSFDPDEAEELAWSIRSRDDKQDPLWAAFNAPPRRKPREDLLTALEAGDPFWLQISIHLDAAMLRHSRTHLTKGIWFDGKVYGPDLESLRLLTIGQRLGQCGASASCPMDDVILQACAEGFFCAKDRQEFMRRSLGLTDLTESERAEALSIADRFSSALQRRDVNVFLKPD
ncbi:hypothetical protein GCM10027034_01680 [Ramlibacter solisilvae]|uniref:Uncharacterized protein n=1 Tax=Ramlibacter tataouinensis TaxID=94132 RepID=A0A127JNZ1_9BURK|nr:hypothetical protein [Ramlibacter tataouinensis]AMO21720.1 hypothetical protein UC35_01075 [Ramlibacter tataouinensis]